jgi:hypothetical protein
MRRLGFHTLRRQAMWALFMGALAIGLAACGGGNSSESPPPAPAPTVSADGGVVTGTAERDGRACATVERVRAMTITATNPQAYVRRITPAGVVSTLFDATAEALALVQPGQQASFATQIRGIAVLDSRRIALSAGNAILVRTLP